MTRLAAALVALLATLMMTATPAQAARAESTQTLTLSEARGVVDHLLRNVIGPTVTSAHKPYGRSRVKVWGCEVHAEVKGSCHARLIAGDVVCTGLFLVDEKVRVYNAWPKRMNCRS